MSRKKRAMSAGAALLRIQAPRLRNVVMPRRVSEAPETAPADLPVHGVGGVVVGDGDHPRERRAHAGLDGGWRRR